MNTVNAVVFIDEKKPSLFEKPVHELKCPGEVKYELECLDETEVFFIKRGTIELHEKSAVELRKAIEERFKVNGLDCGRFGSVSVCCHFGGGGEFDVYEKTVSLNQDEDQKWHFLAISKTLMLPDWMINDQHAFFTLDRSVLIGGIENSIQDAKQKYHDIIQKIRDISDILTSLGKIEVAGGESRNTNGCAVVFGCSCAEDQLKKLCDSLSGKREQSEVFVCNKDGIFYSTWKGWDKGCLAHECITRFSQDCPNARIFAVSAVPYGEDITRLHEIFTDWMFAGWIDSFGEENIRFYGKDEGSLKSLMDDLYEGQFNKGEKLSSDSCHLEDWYNYLMFRMKH